MVVREVAPRPVYRNARKRQRPTTCRLCQAGRATPTLAAPPRTSSATEANVFISFS